MQIWQSVSNDHHSACTATQKLSITVFANSFRAILYRAGKLLGVDATIYLDRIPDRDLRLLAQIELAAALVGLPELSGPRRFRTQSLP